MAIEGVIFDYGMVLSHAQEPEALAALKTITGLSEADFQAHYWRHRHNYDLGNLNGKSFWKAISDDAGIALTDAQVERLIENDVIMWSTLNEEMLGWVEALQDAGFKTAILSNMVEELMQYMVQEFAWLGRFDHHTWSCQLRIAKPDPAIYHYTCEKLGVAPQNALFLDDKAENIAAAEGIGLHAIQFSTAAALRRELERRNLHEALPPIPELIPERNRTSA
jgi:putative hydrolase of the HAD superfamily